MRKRRSIWLYLPMILALGLPAGAIAQEAEAEDNSMVLRISFFKCNLSGGAGAAIAEEIETQAMPVARQLVSEGVVVDHGYFYHWWADEWNVGIYTIAENIQDVLDFEEASGERLEAQYGDGPTAFGTGCPEHKDGFYTMGPSAAQMPTP